jgi:hypothetical protein
MQMSCKAHNKRDKISKNKSRSLFKVLRDKANRYNDIFYIKD